MRLEGWVNRQIPEKANDYEAGKRPTAEGFLKDLSIIPVSPIALCNINDNHAYVNHQTLFNLLIVNFLYLLRSRYIYYIICVLFY